MENFAFQEYVGGMIRKILYFLLRRINFSPEKAAAAKNVNPAERKLEKSVERRIFRFFSFWWKSIRKAVEKRKVGDLCTYNKAIIFVRNLI